VVAVRDAATVVLVRDRPRLEVLVMQRNPDAIFGPGATVFPGGAIDPADRATNLLVRTVGGQPDDAERILCAPGDAVARWHAAARECFEEAGVLLARTRDGALVSGEQVARLAPWRRALHQHDATWGELLEAEDLVVDLRDLHVFAHWLTPVGPPRRYDTWFFVAAAPDEHDAAHDDVELVASSWLTPRDALERNDRGEIDLIFPTWRTLVALDRFDRAGAVLDAVRAAHRPDGRVMVVGEGSGERVLLPGDEERSARPWTVPLPEPDLTVDRALLERREGVA
jgi:8-oxo-dGTP pyrophosphatase MutT (NUDIX family)